MLILLVPVIANSFCSLSFLEKEDIKNTPKRNHKVKLITKTYYYLAVNINREIIYFSHPFNDFCLVTFHKQPKLWDKIDDIIPQNSLPVFNKAIENLSDRSINYITEKFLLPDNNIELEVTFHAIFDSQLIVFVEIEEQKPHPVVSNEESINDTLNKYSFFTSHTLRAPLSNILGLSNIFNDPKLESYDFQKIKKLFEDIQQQAEKLDAIVFSLNSLLLEDGYNDLFRDRNIAHKISTIVLVDDDLFINKMHERIINQTYPHLNTLVFNDPREALKYIGKYSTDLIFLDINMPDINGWEFLRLMDVGMITADVIIVSSSISLSDKKQAYHFKQVKNFINKPLNSKIINEVLGNNVSI